MNVTHASPQAMERKLPSKRSFLDDFFQSVGGGPAFAVNYWDGSRVVYGGAEPEFTVEFAKEPALLDLLASPSLFFGEAYMRGDIDITGSYRAVARALDAAPAQPGEGLTGRLVSRGLSTIASAVRSLSRQKADIAAHYDIGNDFFSLWLDKPTLSYSCAYFRKDDDSLSVAQEQKIDLVLRKLRLERGMRVLDIGCGWGGLAVGAARRYGASVTAITLSEEQASAVRARLEEHGLADTCEVRLCNYLELDEAEPFDRVVSVGMFEHVGKEHYPDYFGKVASLLRAGGLSLLHTLTKNKAEETDPWIARRIFPGGRIPALTEIVEQLPAFDFHLLHAESLRRHYVRTLDAWYDNFSRPDVAATVRSMFGQAFFRMWGLYLRMSSAFLAVGDLDVHQFVFTRGVNDSLPMTLESVYTER